MHPNTHKHAYRQSSIHTYVYILKYTKYTYIHSYIYTQALTCTQFNSRTQYTTAHTFT